MQLIRTTLRLDKNLKKEIEILALKEGLNFQKIVSIALNNHLKNSAKNEAKSFFIPSHDLGVPLDNLTRDDYYDDPNFD